jgi:anti-anti-sigma regulatory factor
VTKKKSPRRAKPTRIDLGARLSIAHAAELHRTLTAGLASGGPLVIDGGDVEEVDTAILQLLAGLWRAVVERSIDCKWDGASDELRRLAKLVGMAEMLYFESASLRCSGNVIA